MIAIPRLLMQTVVLAMEQLWANRFRSILTMLGIIIGVGSTIGISVATTALEKSVLKEFASVGANRVWVFPRRPRDQPNRYSWQQIRLKVAEADGMLAAAPSLDRLTPIKQFSAAIQVGDRVVQNVPVQGVRPVWHDIEGRKVLEGRQFNSEDELQRLNVCYINDKALEELRLDNNAAGRTAILIDGRRFLVVGIVETKSVSPMFGGGEPRTEVFIPFATANAMKPEPFYGIYVAAQTKSPELFEDAKAELRFYMRNARGLKGDDPDSFGVEAIEQYIDQFKRVAAGITVVAVIIVAISLLVGGIGIMNIMLASVSERTREIGLRKAVGARPGIILMQFLVEAVVLSLVGAVVGILVGYGLTLIATRIPSSPVTLSDVPAWALIVSVVASTAIGIIAGMFPAIKAARLDPIDALRHE